MADGQEDAAALEADPLPEEEQLCREDEGEREAAGGDDEEDDDVDGLASFLESEILSGSSADDPLDVSALDRSLP